MPRESTRLNALSRHYGLHGAGNTINSDMACLSHGMSVTLPCMRAQVRTFDLVQKDKIFAIGYCFGGGGVLELMRSWPNTPGLLGER